MPMKRDATARNPLGYSDNAHPERRCYRFVNDPRIWRRQLLISTALLLIIPLSFLSGIGLEKETLLALFSKGEKTLVFFSCFLLLFVLVLTIVFSFWRRKRILIDHQGITFKGFWGMYVPRYIGWSELAALRTVDIKLWGRQFQRSLIFFFRFSRERPFPIAAGRQELYCGEGHGLSLLQAVEVFAGPVEPISEQERKKAVSLQGTQDLGKEVGHVVLTALLLMAVAVGLLFSLGAYSLPDPVHTYFYWGGPVAAVLISAWYMRGIEQKLNMLMPLVIIAGVAVFLMTPVIAGLPCWFGDEMRETFSLTEDGEKEQVWQMVGAPELELRIKAAPKNRVHRGVGATMEITVYRGPGRLNSVLQKEYRALWRYPVM